MPVADALPNVFTQFQSAQRASPATEKDTIGLAVSGGGDSIALMNMAARVHPTDRLHAITVDHGLRPEAQDEIALVASQAAALGIAHTVVRWTWDGRGNLQAAARTGRWMAMREWATTHNLREVWLGHTEDDQIETFLMRLARGSGVDGLTGMHPLTEREGLRIRRPLLGIARADLRAWLRSEQIAWCDDPSNEDPRFDRVRARQMFAQLEDLGLTRKRLLQTVAHMQAAHLSLEAAAQAFARRHVRQDAGDLLLSAPALELGKADTPRRVMAAAFGWVGSGTYRPRFEQLLETVAQARKGSVVTLAGCIMAPEGSGTVRLMREAAATRPVQQQKSQAEATGVFWDRRWFLEGPLQQGLTYKALGAGIKKCPDWRQSGMPRTSLLASPSVWNGDALLSAPLAGLPNGWSARIVADFHTSSFAIED